jgi:hypothetical protein
MIVQFLMGLAILMYMVFTVYCIFVTATSRVTVRADYIGKLIWYHGAAWIVAMILICLFTLALLFANFIMSAMKLTMFVI